MSRLIRAELRKFFTTRAWWGMLIGVVAVSVGFALLIGLISGRTQSGGLPPVTDPATVRSVYTAGIGTTYLFSIAAGILAMAGEWRHQTISATFLASPHRGQVVLAKIVSLVVVGGMYGVASVVSGVLAGAPVIAGRGGQLRLLTDGVPRSLALGVLAVGLWGLFGLGIATLIRNQVAALLIAIGSAWIVEPILSAVLTQALHRPGIAKFLPSSATSAMLQPAVGDSGAQLLPWWGGALLMAAYAAVFAALGAALTQRRDVT